VSLQKSLRKFQSFIDRCAEQRSAAPGPLEDDLSHLPHATAGALSAVCQLDRQVSLALGRLVVNINLFFPTHTHTHIHRRYGLALSNP